MRQRNYLLTMAATFLFFLAVSGFALMPRQLWELGATDSVIGWVMGVWQISTAVAMPIIGVALHRHSPRWFMAIGAIGLAASCVALAFVHQVDGLLYAIRAFQGLAFALFFVSAGTMVVTVVPEAQRAQGIAWWGAGVLITHALAPFFGELLLEHGTFAHLYLGLAVACAAAAVISLLLAPERPSEAPPTPMVGLMRKPAVALGLVALACSSLGFGTLYSFLSAFTEKEQLGPVASFFGAYTVASLLIRFIGGTWADHRDRRLIIVPALLLSSGALAALALVTGPLHVAAVGALYGASSGLSYPALMAFVVDQAEPVDRPRVVALDNWAFTIGMLVAAFAFGPVAEAVGMRLAFVGAGALSSLAALALVVLRTGPAPSAHA